MSSLPCAWPLLFDWLSFQHPRAGERGRERGSRGGRAEQEEGAIYKAAGMVRYTHPYTEPYGPENIIIVFARHCPMPLPCINSSSAPCNPTEC